MSKLIEAIKRGDAAEVEQMLADDPSLLTAAENNVSAIMLSVYHGKPEIGRLFVRRGASLSFHEAMALGESSQVRSMLAADPSLLNSKSPDGYPALGLAIFFRHPELARFLIEEGADVNAQAGNAMRVAPLHAAAGVCDHQTLKMLLARGADVKARQQLDYTPLHTAAALGDIEMAKLFLRHGADPSAKGTDGLTPADVAVKYEKPEFAEWIRGMRTED